MSSRNLSTARTLLAGSDWGPKGIWPRAVAILARQHLESAVDRLWSTNGMPEVLSASFRCKFLCLPLVLKDPELVADIRAAWFFLTRACHHHQYELAPVAAELDTWISKVEHLLRTLE